MKPNMFYNLAKAAIFQHNPDEQQYIVILYLGYLPLLDLLLSLAEGAPLPDNYY